MSRAPRLAARAVWSALVSLFAPTAAADVWQPPARRVVADYATRQVVGVVLVGAAATLCWRSGMTSYALPFLVIAVSRVPDLLVALLALADEDRRRGLRPRRRPGTLAAALSVVLFGAALVTGLGGAVTAEWLAALAAGAGLGVSAWPTQLVYPAQERRPRAGAGDQAAAPPRTGSAPNS